MIAEPDISFNSRSGAEPISGCGPGGKCAKEGYAQMTSDDDNSIPVNASNFIRAESDLYFDRAVKEGAWVNFIIAGK